MSAGQRRYFIDVKQTREGDKFITIAESRRIFDNNTGEFYIDKTKIFLYKEDFEKFQKGLANALSFIETGIEPEPVVPLDSDFRSNDGDDRASSFLGNETENPSYTIDDIDFKY